LETDVAPTLLTLDSPNLQTSPLTHAVQTMLNQIGSASSEEEGIMFTVDIPYEPITNLSAQYSAVLISQSKSKAPVPPKEKDMVYCQDVESADGTSSFNSLPVLYGVLFKLGYSEKQIQSGKVPASVLSEIKVTVSEAPKRGTVTRMEPDGYGWKYKPEEDYEGPDKVSFVVEARGRRFKIMVNLLVHQSVNENAKKPACEAFFRKPINKTGMLDGQPTYAAAWSPLLRQAFSQIAYSFTNLPGTAVGETVGEGTSATITLDTNAAGHGWFIDSTIKGVSDDFFQE